MENKELTDLLVSWITLSAAFALLLSKNGLDQLGFSNALAISALAVGTGFLLHELSHKYVAIYFGAKAEFRAWNIGLIFALVLAVFTSFIFAAPGAVYIYGKKITIRENGIISLAGPLTNIVIGLLSFGIEALYQTGDITMTAHWVGVINLSLAMFNLLPLFILDGAKVFAWNKMVWGALFFPLVYILFLL